VISVCVHHSAEGFEASGVAIQGRSKLRLLQETEGQGNLRQVVQLGPEIPNLQVAGPWKRSIRRELSLDKPSLFSSRS
jgi:hypothetical protein